LEFSRLVDHQHAGLAPGAAVFLCGEACTGRAITRLYEYQAGLLSLRVNFEDTLYPCLLHRLTVAPEDALTNRLLNGQSQPVCVFRKASGDDLDRPQAKGSHTGYEHWQQVAKRPFQPQTSGSA
jgi:hypothetical protein